EPTPMAVTAVQTDVPCNGGSNGSATVTVSGGTGAYTYSWSPSGGTAATASGLTAGNYTVTITDANNCTTTQNFTINEPTPMAVTDVQTDVPCNGGSNGSATVTVSGGTGAYTYSWAPTGGTAATASGLIAGNYTVTITDASNCTTTQSFTINEPTPITVTAVQTDVPCNGASNGSATVTVSGGTGAYTYSWSPSGGTAATASGLTAGNYTVTITDANSCTTTQSFVINEPTPMVVVTSQNNVPCNGASNGSATVTVSGGTGAYTYSWSPSGGTAATASGLTAGNYTVTITDANNCTTTQSFVINEPAPIAVTATQTNVSCNGASNGSATVTVSGGTGAYTYSWSPTGGTAATASGLTAGNYTVTITDANNCTTTQSFVITEPIAVFINTQPLSNTITAGQNTTFTIGSTNATGYQWQMSTNNGGNWNNVSNGGTNPLFAGATTATLTLTNIPKIYDGYLFRVLVNSGTCAPSTSSSATLTVNNILIQAVDDNFTATPVNNASGGIAGNVITNDLFNSLPVVSTDVTITLVNNGGLTGVTIGNDGSVNVLPSSTQGTYTLTYSICEIANPGNCDSATAIVVVSPPLSVGTFETFTVSLYPNPTISEVFIKFNEIHQDAKVHVYDMNGRKIMERPLRSTINSIDLSGFEDGVYLFEINSVNGKTIKRVIKKP
ncbi:T9SS type A sorting domain-containing protein, partial [Flavobacterium sp. '19STA2R22 D10 B1']|uniref:T9SS type A sorting domain-containing protein n=1 Tax=Flavobacterium aerium TaxID=3037261 RepID=UPI00278BDE80